MGKILDTYCDICGEVGETRYIDLFTIGSEGARLCHDCEMMVVEFIWEKKREQLSLRIQAVKKRKAKGE